MIYANSKGYVLYELTNEIEPYLCNLIGEESGFLKCEDFTATYVAVLKENTLFYVIKDEPADKYAGYISISKTDTYKPEFGIYLSPKYRNQRIATEFLPKAAGHYSLSHRVSYFIYKAKSYNVASQKLAKKLGAIKLCDEGDVMYNDIMKILAELPPESREKYLKELENDYNPEAENIIIYKLEFGDNK